MITKAGISFVAAMKWRHFLLTLRSKTAPALVLVLVELILRLKSKMVAEKDLKTVSKTVVVVLMPRSKTAERLSKTVLKKSRENANEKVLKLKLKTVAERTGVMTLAEMVVLMSKSVTEVV